jgi:hypothetical protein
LAQKQATTAQYFILKTNQTMLHLKWLSPIFLLSLHLTNSTSQTINPQLQKLVAAYPDFLAKAENNTLIWKDGTRTAYNDGKTPTDYLHLLDEADLRDQMENAPYPQGANTPTPTHNIDPGRVRCEAFFKKMYGNDAAAVAKNLVQIDWFGTPLRVTQLNGAAAALTKVRDELALQPDLKKYLTPAGGTFMWRIIAQTHRLSMHSFGIAIDINTKYSSYWQWAGKGVKVQEGSPNIQYKNQIPAAIVRIFEKHGFIWGGKWYHYDTMHFEYRPELL